MGQSNARGNPIVSDAAYDQATWDGKDLEAPSKNAMRDKVVSQDSAISSNTSHASGDGSDHADVATNTSHSTGDGSDHADVATNTSHSTGDGSDHSDVADNTTHSTGDGSDHSDVAANTAASHAESHTIASHSDTTATGTELEELTDGSTTTLHNHSVASHALSDHSAATSALDVGGQNVNNIGKAEYDVGVRTISSGAASVGDYSTIAIAAESGDTDTLDTLSGGHEGQIITLLTDSNDNITITNAYGGGQQFFTKDGLDLELGGFSHGVQFILRSGEWHEWARSEPIKRAPAGEFHLHAVGDTGARVYRDVFYQRGTTGSSSARHWMLEFPTFAATESTEFEMQVSITQYSSTYGHAPCRILIKGILNSSTANAFSVFGSKLLANDTAVGIQGSGSANVSGWKKTSDNRPVIYLYVSGILANTSWTHVVTIDYIKVSNDAVESNWASGWALNYLETTTGYSSSVAGDERFEDNFQRPVSYQQSYDWGRGNLSFGNYTTDYRPYFTPNRFRGNVVSSNLNLTDASWTSLGASGTDLGVRVDADTTYCLEYFINVWGRPASSTGAVTLRLEYPSIDYSTTGGIHGFPIGFGANGTTTPYAYSGAKQLGGAALYEEWGPDYNNGAARALYRSTGDSTTAGVTNQITFAMQGNAISASYYYYFPMILWVVYKCGSTEGWIYPSINFNWQGTQAVVTENSYVRIAAGASENLSDIES